MMYQTILAQLQESELPSDHPDLRRLARKLTEKRFDYNAQSQKVFTMSIISSMFLHPSKRDTLLKMGRLCPKFSVFTELAS